MKNLCIIPARGGSKRIPRKNIKDFFGKPIIAYSIDAALKSGLFNEVMVSTDDEEIAEIAKKWGAKVPFMRSQENANDYATTVDVVQEVIDHYNQEGKQIENLCCLYPCAPLVTPEKLNEAYALLLKRELRAVIPVVKFGFPIQRAFQIDGHFLHYFYPEHEKSRSQDLEPAYHDAGQFYWTTAKSLFDNKTLVPSNSGYIELDEMSIQDIDNESDWRLAEIKYKLSNEVS